MNLQPGCPWYDLHTQYPPNIDWCEEKLCSWVMTPNNAWTNLAYLIIGWMMLKRTQNSNNPMLRFFGMAAIIVGVSSFAYHISLNAFTQVFDFLGMYVFCLLVIRSNLTRSNQWPLGKAGNPRFWAITIVLTVTTALLTTIQFPIQTIVAILIAMIVFTELRQKTENRKNFWIGIVWLTVAGILSASDIKRILCQPENHWFQAHGAWHITSAIGLWFSFKHAELTARK